jgi:ABC-type nitrate/sulfonate/bicarbonate transport system permease component
LAACSIARRLAFLPGPLKIADAFVQLLRAATLWELAAYPLLGEHPPRARRLRLAFSWPCRWVCSWGCIPRSTGTRSVLSLPLHPADRLDPARHHLLHWAHAFRLPDIPGRFFPIFTSTLVGVARVEPIHRKVGVVHGASKFWTLCHVVVPTVLPDIMAGMRVGLGTAWLTIVAAELAGGISTGLGRMMTNYAELLQVPQVIVGMLLIGFIGFLMNEFLLLIERYLFRWRWQVSL